MLAVSRKTRNWVMVLILVPAAVYGVARLAIWYSVRDGLQTVQETMAPFASVEHSRILSPVFGAFGATGIRIKPHLFNDEIAIGSALVHVDDPIEKYQLLSATMSDTIPTSFNISLNGVRIPLSGDIAAWFNSNAVPATATGPASMCKTGAGFTLGDMKKLGYDELVANVKLDYAYDRRVRGLSTYLKLEIREMFEMTLEGRIPPSDVVFSVDRMTGIPRLSDLTLTLDDLSWSTRFNRHCAETLGISEAEYVTTRVEGTRDAFTAAGFEPSSELMAGLEQFARGAAPLTLSLNPHDPFDLTQLEMEGDPQYMIDKLGIEVRFEGKPVQNLGAVKKVVEKEVDPEPEQTAETFQPTPLEELPQFLKSQVRIFTIDGKVHEGYLESVNPRSIVLTRQMAGGSATFDVGRDNVEKSLVLRP